MARTVGLPVFEHNYRITTVLATRNGHKNTGAVKIKRLVVYV